MVAPVFVVRSSSAPLTLPQNDENLHDEQLGGKGDHRLCRVRVEGLTLPGFLDAVH